MSTLIEQTIKSWLPEKLANGLSKDDAFTLYTAKNKVEISDTGLVIIDPATGKTMTDRRLNNISVENHVREFVESFGSLREPGRGGNDETGKFKTEIGTFTKRSEVEDYCEKKNVPISERSGILANAMKNQGFKMNE